MRSVLNAPTIPAYLARAAALEQLCQHHVRHDPLCPWWQNPKECACGLTALLRLYEQTGVV